MGCRQLIIHQHLSGLLRAPLRCGRQKTGRLNPAYPAARKSEEYPSVTYKAVITKNEVAIAIMDHRKITGTDAKAVAGTAVSGSNHGQESAWVPSGIRKTQQALAL